jgi:hypothetical protein
MVKVDAGVYLSCIAAALAVLPGMPVVVRGHLQSPQNLHCWHPNFSTSLQVVWSIVEIGFVAYVSCIV